MIEDFRFVFYQLYDIRHVVDILVVAFIIYHVLRLIKGTRGWQITLGITAISFFYYFTRLVQLRTVEWLFAKFFPVFLFALIVIFQSEIRRGLAELGRGRVFPKIGSREEKARLEEIVLAATTLSNQKIGALIVVEGEIGLKNYIERGIKLDAVLTYDLLVTIFNPQSPLHDGARHRAKRSTQRSRLLSSADARSLPE